MRDMSKLVECPLEMVRGALPGHQLALTRACTSLARSLALFIQQAPKAFRAGNDEDRAFLQAVGRNWVASSLAVGARETQEGALMSTVSAGVEAHPSTTFAATEDVFAFLDRAARRRRKRAFEP